jgi:hypothetical protein
MQINLKDLKKKLADNRDAVVASACTAAAFLIYIKTKNLIDDEMTLCRTQEVFDHLEEGHHIIFDHPNGETYHYAPFEEEK